MAIVISDKVELMVKPSIVKRHYIIMKQCIVNLKVLEVATTKTRTDNYKETFINTQTRQEIVLPSTTNR